MAFTILRVLFFGGAGCVSLWIAMTALRRGTFRTRWGRARRYGKPGAFWLGVVVTGAGGLVCIGLALYTIVASLI